MTERPRAPLLRLYEQIAQQLGDDIRAGRLAPGEKLPSEEQLAAEFGASRPTVREALKLLRATRLITSKTGPKGGHFVQGIDWSRFTETARDCFVLMQDLGLLTLRDLIDARILLEVPTAGRAAEMREEEDVEVLEAVLAHEESGQVGPFNLDFHIAVAVAAHNAIVESFMTSIHQTVEEIGQRFEMPSEAERLSLLQHRAIAVTIQAGERDAAQRAMKEHLEAARDVYDGLLRREDSR